MKTIVLTGCTRGLGRAMAGFFVQSGARVFGCGRSSSGLAIDFTALDVADDAAVRRWAERVVRAAGAPDLLINNAAVMAANAPLWEVPRAEFDAVVDVNIKGVANVLRHFTPAMIARGRGIIVNLSSGWGRSTSPDVAAYCASKWAIEGLTQALAQELPGGMAAVALNPGIIDTEMLRSCFGGSAAHYPSAEEWIRRAGPFLRRLSAKDNGKSLTVPGAAVD